LARHNFDQPVELNCDVFAVDPRAPRKLGRHRFGWRRRLSSRGLRSGLSDVGKLAGTAVSTCWTQAPAVCDRRLRRSRLQQQGATRTICSNS
jgi:hypothetical protein